MSGINSAENKLRNLNKQSKKVDQEKKVSVVCRNEDGSIDWPPNCNDGVLVVPKPMTEKVWGKKYGHQE